MKKYEILDGNSATQRIAYAMTEFASIYPITPSTPMAEEYEIASSKNEKNIFGSIPKCYQMQSEAGVAGALHGSLSAGALSTTFTCSQGLLLMIPNMYKIAGELLPCVIHVSARTIATHALNIFNDHSDIMACAQTGFALLCANNPQECADLALIAHLATYKARIPFLHFFDGFRTSHELKKVEMPEMTKIKKLLPLKEIEEFRSSGLNSNKPYLKGSTQNGDIYFQNIQARQKYYLQLPTILEETMRDFEKTFKRHYSLFDYAGNPNAKNVIVMLGSATETMEEVLENNLDIGIIKVRLVQPFSAKHFIHSLPKNVENICILERQNTNSNNGEILFKEIASALTQANLKNINLTNGIYGLGGKDFTPAMAQAVINHTKNQNNNGKRFFTIGIDDDVTNTSLTYAKEFENKHLNLMFFGIGSDGTISASKNTIKVIGENTNNYIQGFFEYDSKKSGGMTVSHIRIGKEPIQSTYKINKADFIAVNNYDYVALLNISKYLKQNSTLLINTPFAPELLNEKLTDEIKADLIYKNVKVYAINAYKESRELGLKNKINTIMQASFFSIFNLLSEKKIKKILIEKVTETFKDKGQKLLESNLEAINIGFELTKQINLTSSNQHNLTNENNILDKINSQLTRNGDLLPVSVFNASGKVETHTSCLDNRNISEIAPKYVCENCIQCNICALACPHSVIRPKLISNKEKLPEGIKVLPSKLLNDHNFALYVDTKHCTGCGVCAKVCPAKNKALIMEDKQNLAEQIKQEKYLKSIKNPIDELDRFNLRHTQFFEPYFEYCGACGGCGETPYLKLLSQLFGDKLVIANATGCSSIYSGSEPTCPFTKDEKGKGIAWANSLFEDNAEFGLGIKLGQEIRSKDDIVFIVGGDGWAYDIGYGGLDHILTSGKNINILVLDTEIYSNTGGQQSKASPKGTKTAFCSNGKSNDKKPLGLLAMAYQNVFVAQVSLGANPKQTIDAFKQAVEFDGVSLIIAYCPCINHGIDMSESHLEMLRAVSSGHFPLFTFNPNTSEKLKLQSKTTSSIENFKNSEKRFKNISSPTDKKSTEEILIELQSIINKKDA